MAVSKSHIILDNSVEPDIHVCTGTNTKTKYKPSHHEWYQIRADSTTPEHKILSPQLTPVPHHLTWSVFTSIGSKIYITGGRDPDEDYTSNEVYYIDACNQSDGWKKASSMKAARYSHYAFSHDGQMYVIGGNSCRNSDEPWAEVYDPDRDTWHALPRIPDDVISLSIAGHAVVSGGGVNGNGKRILLHPQYSDEVFYYDLELERLGVSSANILNGSIRPRSSGSSSFAFLDKILYYFRNWDELYAYDISKPNSTYKTVILSPELRLLLTPDGLWCHFCIVSLGNGKLAVITSNKSHHHVYGHFIRIRCTKLRMLKVVNDKGELEIEAKLISHSNYYVRGDFVNSCLTITQEGASPNRRVWAPDEDLKLIEALRISQIASKYRVGDGFDTETYCDFVEKILNVTLPESNLKADPHIKTRIATLKRKFEIVDEMNQGATMRGFAYDDYSKRVVADQSVWESYSKSDERIAQFKDSRFPLYRELCDVFRNNHEFDIIKLCF